MKKRTPPLPRAAAPEPLNAIDAYSLRALAHELRDKSARLSFRTRSMQSREGTDALYIVAGKLDEAAAVLDRCLETCGETRKGGTDG